MLFSFELGITRYEEVRGVNPLRIVEYILLLILVVGFGYLTYKGWLIWSGAAGIIIPLIIIVLLFIEDRKK
jgi:membrane protein YdbS with pleckstrin-like domain